MRNLDKIKKGSLVRVSHLGKPILGFVINVQSHSDLCYDDEDRQQIELFLPVVEVYSSLGIYFYHGEQILSCI